MFRQIQGKTSRAFPTLVFFVVVLSLLMGFFPTSAYAKNALGGPATLACSTVHFIGVRGSGDPPQGKNDKNDRYMGMGEVAYYTYKLFQNKMKDKGISVSGEGLNYKAVPVWNPFIKLSVAGGVKTLTGILNSSNESCNVLVGYSQGAWVLHDTLDSNQLSSSARGKVKAVLVFGDPHFNPKAKYAIRYGAVPQFGVRDEKRAYETAEASSGSLGAHDFPSGIFGVRSYCKRYDPFCSLFAQGIAGNFVNCVPSVTVTNVDALKKWCGHLDYYTDEAIQDQATSWLANLFSNRGASNSNNNIPRLTSDCAHLKTPWVALYSGINYSGRELCFEGRGTIYFYGYSFDKQARSVNIAANVVFYDHARNKIAFGYGFQTGNLMAWKDRIMAMTINS